MRGGGGGAKGKRDIYWGDFKQCTHLSPGLADNMKVLALGEYTRLKKDNSWFLKSTPLFYFNFYFL